MSVNKQFDANRLNARKSTGPRSAEAQAASIANPLKTGLHAASHVIRGESAAELEALIFGYYEHWKPAAPDQRALVDALAYNEWLLRRFRKIEGQIWKLRFAANEERGSLDLDNPSADVYMHNSLHFERLQRRIDSTERNYRRTLEDLQNLQLLSTPNHPPREPAPAWQPAAPKPTPPQGGFVSPSLPDHADNRPVTVNQVSPDSDTQPGPPADKTKTQPLTLKYRA